MRFFQHPVDHLLNRFRFLAVEAVLRERVARPGLRRIPAEHGYQRILAGEALRVRVRCDFALIGDVMHEQERYFNRREIEAAESLLRRRRSRSEEHTSELQSHSFISYAA